MIGALDVSGLDVEQAAAHRQGQQVTADDVESAWLSRFSWVAALLVESYLFTWPGPGTVAGTGGSASRRSCRSPRAPDPSGSDRGSQPWPRGQPSPPPPGFGTAEVSENSALS